MAGVSYDIQYPLALSNIPGKATRFKFPLYFGVIWSGLIFWWKECLELYITLRKEGVRESCWVYYFFKILLVEFLV